MFAKMNLSKRRCCTVLIVLAAVFARDILGQNSASAPVTGQAARQYPLTFTTPAYEKEALKQVIDQANQIAQELRLPDSLPITESNLLSHFITPYGMAKRIGAIGNVTTTNYTYYVSVGGKFSFLEGTRQDVDRVRWYYKYSWPIEKLDTNAAYQMATQWLDAVSMDVKGLNEDCDLHVEPTAIRGQGTNAVFLPVYWVYWTKGWEGRGSVASVEFFAPTKTLMQLRVEDSDYILRKPLQFTNLDYLLSTK